MYNQNAVKEVASLNVSVCSDLHANLQGQVSTMYNIINSIEGKLHDILNLREPENGNQDHPQPKLSDFSSKMQEELNSMNNQNIRLEKILNHLERII